MSTERRNRLHRIIVDFGDTKVASMAERPIWDGFRIWESVQWSMSTVRDFRKLRRMVNTVGSPPFDIFSDWLMDFATIAAACMGRSDWENFRRLVLVHVPDCLSNCWYCFNDAWDKEGGNCKIGEVTASEIVQYFEEQQRRDSKKPGSQSNILRLSGGEPLTQPALVEDLAKELRKKKDIFLWLDTNLIPIAQAGSSTVTHIKQALQAVKRLGKRAAVHACFHGLTDPSLKEVTGIRKLEFQELIEAYKVLKDIGLYVYPRFNPCITTPREVEAFFLKMYELHPLEPSKVYLGPIELNYPASHDRMTEIRRNTNRTPPALHSSVSVIHWWNKIMEIAYGAGYAVIPRHMTSCLTSICRKKEDLYQQISAHHKKRPEHEFISVSKGSYRESYALKMLEALVLPVKAHMVIELEVKYIEPNMFEHVKFFPEKYKGKDLLVVSTHHTKRGKYHIVLLRWAKVLSIRATSIAINIDIEIGEYPHNIIRSENSLEISSGEGIYDLFSEYAGKQNLPMNGYFCMLMGLPQNITDQKNNHHEIDSNSKRFVQVVESLNQVPEQKLHKNIYYRISNITRTNGEPQNVKMENGSLLLRPGDEIAIELETLNLNLGNFGYPSEEDAALNVYTTELEEKIQVLSQKHISLSKFGQTVTKLRLRPEYEQLRGEIIFQPPSNSARIVELRLPYISKPEDLSYGET